MLDHATLGRPFAVKSVAYTATAGTTAAVGNQTRRVIVTVTTAAYVKVGDGTATSSDMYVPADFPLGPFTIGAGETVSAIQVATGGTLYVTELTG